MLRIDFFLGSLGKLLKATARLLLAMPFILTICLVRRADSLSSPIFLCATIVELTHCVHRRTRFIRSLGNWNLTTQGTSPDMRGHLVIVMLLILMLIIGDIWRQMGRLGHPLLLSLGLSWKVWDLLLVWIRLWMLPSNFAQFHLSLSWVLEIAELHFAFRVVRVWTRYYDFLTIRSCSEFSRVSALSKRYRRMVTSWVEP